MDNQKKLDEDEVAYSGYEKECDATSRQTGNSLTLVTGI